MQRATTIEKSRAKPTPQIPRKQSPPPLPDSLRRGPRPTGARVVLQNSVKRGAEPARYACFDAAARALRNPARAAPLRLLLIRPRRTPSDPARRAIRRRNLPTRLRTRT
ncbi:hypothetical protein [Lysobacter gummosus]|uniref:hypothetical protein n=1 Tax=Lysobacter gummosus TaxID=262324 RepID=UPI003634733E